MEARQVVFGVFDWVLIEKGTYFDVLPERRVK